MLGDLAGTSPRSGSRVLGLKTFPYIRFAEDLGYYPTHLGQFCGIHFPDAVSCLEGIGGEVHEGVPIASD